MDPTREYVSGKPDHGGGHWPAQATSKRPIHAPPVPQTFVSVPVTSIRWAGSQPVFVTALESPVADMEHMNGNNVLLGRVGMTQYSQQQYGWVQHLHGLIAGITPATLPGQAGFMYDAFGMSRGLPAQTQGHVHVHAYAEGSKANAGHDFLAQYYARLSLADTGADKKSPIPVTAPSTVTVTPEAPAQQSQIFTETTGTGATGLTITTVTGIASTSTRTITGPDGTVIVPPPIPAHPGCELSLHLGEALLLERNTRGTGILAPS
ncbi:hypothetical protein SMACR_05603 [Sordaria macrospora]|uniref:WGS project CABT00000000 data, contig 2.26 n=2 Tax=Sordaria macrospora TaxID=5147 RepID=F7W472_SORMK|nr:uncharacterized protein SMAC_05603 [Sordaria macrospora k-hell]KAA8628625.1 hypothetical protein SMACR_05603 [Sordaria macrospora]KAH7633854.1 hypothetical protein B0T09DRAFT_259768 [Sordaria sp. MPI-SDFR-AT-0083]WPJ59782.1 hypothetical protein SMAC4_05603 [Sordaria macrospora]CCC12426.1 unnamed protein product [Sordaria macrospora k-hell]